MHNKVVFRAASGLNDAGLITLRFNFRGVGDSTGKHDEGRGEMQDVLDALNYLSNEYPEMPITFAGFSFGSRFGIQAVIDDPRVKRLISIGTPIDKYPDYGFLDRLRDPILFVHGDRDEFGSLDNLAVLTARVAQNADTTVEIFEDCGHFFDEHLNELRNAICNWERAQQEAE